MSEVIQLPSPPLEAVSYPKWNDTGHIPHSMATSRDHRKRPFHGGLRRSPRFLNHTSAPAKKSPSLSSLQVHHAVKRPQARSSQKFKSLDKKRSVTGNLEHRCNQLESQLADKEDTLKLRERDLDELMEAFQDMSQKRIESDLAIQDLRNELAQFRTLVNEMPQGNGSSTVPFDDIKAQNSYLNSRLQSVKRELETAMTHCIRLEQQLTDVTNSLCRGPLGGKHQSTEASVGVQREVASTEVWEAEAGCISSGTRA
ncbi:hypothetical protein R3P38DRAFT_2788117 [Favolaschia claudopus]|uniref:Uncharacterized protein n=1 Tax=Favolaschia claudopus TaxID=2862362 RepID=A0AAW0AN51_9AGAR